MDREWLAGEHDRIHVMELVARWTQEGGGAHGESLEETMPEGSSFACVICGSRQTVTVIPSARRFHRLPSGLAA
jgi:hypothetical protein